MKTYRINTISPASNTILNIFFMLYSAICLIPLVIVLSISLSNENEIMKYGFSILPRGFTTQSYWYLFKDSGTILRAYGVSILCTVTGTILTVLNVALFAYPLFRKDFRYRKQFTFFLFFTMLFNGGLVPYYIVVSSFLHMKDTLWSMILPGCFNAFWVIVMRTFYTNTIHDSIIDSGRMDGASEFRIFFQIICPISLPGLATVGLFTTLTYWNDFFNPMLFLTNKQEEYQNLQYMIYRVLSNVEFMKSMAGRLGTAGSQEMSKLPKETLRMAMAIVAIGPIVLAYPFFQKYFVKGLTIGAIKG